jgi:predicted RNase H-like HicB family nuclease
LTDTRYPIVVFWSEEDRIWVAETPDLKSCAAFGQSAGEAVAELDVAVQAWLDAARANGHTLPPPTPARRLLAAE